MHFSNIKFMKFIYRYKNVAFGAKMSLTLDDQNLASDVILTFVK